MPLREKIGLEGNDLDKCPFCGAEKSYDNMYSCETSTVGFADGSPDRGAMCYEKEIAKLKAELADLQDPLRIKRDMEAGRLWVDIW